MLRHLRLALTAAATALALLLPAGASAGEVKVAVAANFTAAANDIAAAFKAATGHDAVLSFGSTGKLYTQIVNGAPFEVFLAADDKTPRKAESEGNAVAGSRFTYAIGKLTLYSSDPQLVDAAGKVLAEGRFAKLAIANPATAPYGAAAEEVLKKRGLYEKVDAKIVQGDNIAQTYQFITTGNAELGFVALSQVAKEAKGSKWLVPQEDYAPIRQDAVLTRSGAASDVAKAFLVFLKGSEAKAIIASYGYGVE
jgi:molybdate transport system substrate-binding protein